MDPIVRYLTESQLPENRGEARWIKNTSVRYMLIDGKLYRRGYSTPYQRCVGPAEADYLMKEIHSGVCGNHSVGKSPILQVHSAGLQAPPTFCCSTSHRHPPPPTLTGAAPAGTGDCHHTVPCSRSETRGTSPLD
ncbi:hypothetical protein TIFTF001_012149 [Ficus carica]|uniref:Uncharacterized protein n=1 Tax=Ficus carica TaxID=3494 RepID=A0AA87ZVH2_FICCA|nr:hypothetical protein TIFTF001_012149 [Ficus carica]